MWVDLTQPFSADMPHSAGVPDPEFEQLRTVGTDGTSLQWYGAPTHAATHVDAPAHFVADGATIDELPPERFVGEGVVLDAAPGEARELGVADLEAAPGEVREGDVVVVRTGWHERWGDGSYAEYPWLAAGVADWLLDRDVALLAVDAISPDKPRAIRAEGWDAYPIHRTLLGNGVLIAEHLGNLDALAGERAIFHFLPLKLEGGDGAPTRAVARPVRE